MIYKILSKYLDNLPGRPQDFDLLFFISIDLIFILIYNSYALLLPETFKYFVYFYDFLISFIWAVDLYIRIKHQRDKTKKIHYLKTHWYEIIGLLPFPVLRFFLLLRGVKIAIAFYKLGKSEEIISRAITREITFRFRDIIVDTIADMVFLQSLKRVEEVMLKLNYTELAKSAFKKYENELNQVVKESLNSTVIMKEFSKIPFTSSIVSYAGDEISKIMSEILETEVMGNIMKEITKDILKEMYKKVQKLDIERLTQQDITSEISIDNK